jgi:hypothetical protein
MMKRVTKQVMRRVALNAFYHGSPTELPAGAVLEARCKEHVSHRSPDGVSYERFIEAQRPPWENSRNCSMYLADSKQALSQLAPHSKYVYEVAPVGHVTAADFGKFAELMAEGPLRNNPLAARTARDYWLSACRQPDGSACVPELPEYLSPALRVLREDKKAKGFEPKPLLVDPDGGWVPMSETTWRRGVGVVRRR